MSLVIHTATKSQYRRLIDNPPHGLLINGADGVGKTAIAQQLIAEILNISIDKLTAYPYFLQVTAMTNSISIDTAREIKHFFELKTIGTQTIRRGILIEHAESLTIEAQNALLKTIEEPPADSIIVLTVGHEQLLLPTIVSRLQRFTVHRPKDEETLAYFSALINDPVKVTSALAISNGLPGLAHAILFLEEHPLLLGIEKAKTFLRASKFTRLNLIDEYVQQKDSLLMIMQALLRIAESSLHKAAQKEDGKSIQQWEKILTATYQAENSLLLNAQSKLVLNNLILEL
ncbi:MAG TPA: AAA family ATPase [Candidatus Saccharimonadales bacterium]|jgi:DNA polymerase-3 subunit delta'|nr:AAA family ATPase [Candidatus Saccharimonadales bacterium]